MSGASPSSPELPRGDDGVGGVRISTQLAIRLLLVISSWILWPIVWFWATLYMFGDYLFGQPFPIDPRCGPPEQYWRDVRASVVILVSLAVLIAPPVLVTWRWWRWRQTFRHGEPRSTSPVFELPEGWRRPFWGFASLLVVVTGVVGWNLDAPVERRDPISLARRFSGLDVPGDAGTIECHDIASGPFGSNLDTHVELALSPSAAIRLTSEARRRGYLPMASSFPSNEDVSRAAVTGLVVSDGEAAARHELGDDRAGLYRYERTGPRSDKVAVLDSARGRIFIRLYIN